MRINRNTGAVIPIGDTGFSITGLTIVSGQQATAVPAMTEWAMVIFMVLAGIGALYYLRREKGS